jgi:hypothetical protein
MNQSQEAEPYVHETLEVEATQLAVREDSAINLFGAASPAEVIAKAAEVATALAAVIDKKGLFKVIGPKRHVLVEGWTLLGSILGVFPVCVWTREINGDGRQGWEARVEAVRDGKVIGAAEAQCLRAEKNWRDRDDFALRSMAQTRATSKALRMPLGFVVTLAGYEACPAEEMDGATPFVSPGPPERPPEPVSQEVQEMLDKAAANRKAAQSSVTSTPEGRQMARDAGFNVTEPEERAQKCRKCGAEVRTFTAKAGHQFDQCVSARKNPAVYDEGGHTYKRLK